MVTLEAAKLIIETVRPLCKPVHLAGRRAWDIADLHFTEHGMRDEDFKGGRANLARCHLRRELVVRGGVLGNWCISPPRPNGEVTLSMAALRLRFLRPGPPAADMLPPPPGPGKARINYYSNPPLSLYDPLASNLLCIWAADAKSGEIQFRILRTTGSWKMGQVALVDLDFELPSSAKKLDGIEFMPSDADMPLPFDDEDEMGGASGIAG